MTQAPNWFREIQTDFILKKLRHSPDLVHLAQVQNEISHLHGEAVHFASNFDSELVETRHGSLIERYMKRDGWSLWRVIKSTDWRRAGQVFTFDGLVGTRKVWY